MAFEKRLVALLLVLCLCGVCMGAVYKVGDKSGWTESGKVDYKAWAASKNFYVGDTIVFEYDNRFSNVVRVNHYNFNACNNMHSYFSLNSGNDSFVIPKTGHFYFISGLPGHCEAGQRVDIRVPKETSKSAPAPSPYKSAPSPSKSAPSPAKSAPSPTQAPAEHHVSPPVWSPASAPSDKKHSGAVTITGMWLAMVVAIVVSFYGFGY